MILLKNLLWFLLSIQLIGSNLNEAEAARQLSWSNQEKRGDSDDLVHVIKQQGVYTLRPALGSQQEGRYAVIHAPETSTIHLKILEFGSAVVCSGNVAFYINGFFRGKAIFPPQGSKMKHSRGHPFCNLGKVIKTDLNTAVIYYKFDSEPGVSPADQYLRFTIVHVPMPTAPCFFVAYDNGRPQSHTIKNEAGCQAMFLRPARFVFPQTRQNIRTLISSSTTLTIESSNNEAQKTSQFGDLINYGKDAISRDVPCRHNFVVVKNVGLRGDGGAREEINFQDYPLTSIYSKPKVAALMRIGASLCGN